MVDDEAIWQRFVPLGNGPFRQPATVVSRRISGFFFLLFGFFFLIYVFLLLGQRRQSLVVPAQRPIEAKIFLVFRFCRPQWSGICD